ncbi:MAG: hypothetical protein JWO67_6238 [Streptosporangiaceae bacterium]|nr:hypothetical protein [Streptosporangiaceae bacterium]
MITYVILAALLTTGFALGVALTTREQLARIRRGLIRELRLSMRIAQLHLHGAIHWAPRPQDAPAEVSVEVSDDEDDQSRPQLALIPNERIPVARFLDPAALAAANAETGRHRLIEAS